MKLTHAVLAATVFIATFGSAKAADLAKPQPAPAAVEEPSQAKSAWTGLYVEGGLGMTSSGLDLTGFDGTVTFGDAAWVGHVGIGYDHMIVPHIVVGVLARAGIDNLTYSEIATKLADRKVEYMVGGRIGFVPRQDWMIYALGGYRFTDVKTEAGMVVSGLKANENGWVAGAGIEAMLTDHMFIGLEYTANLTGKDTVNLSAPDTPILIDVGVTDHVGKARIGFKF